MRFLSKLVSKRTFLVLAATSLAISFVMAENDDDDNDDNNSDENVEDEDENEDTGDDSTGGGDDNELKGEDTELVCRPLKAILTEGSFNPDFNDIDCVLANGQEQKELSDTVERLPGFIGLLAYSVMERDLTPEILASLIRNGITTENYDLSTITSDKLMEMKTVLSDAATATDPASMKLKDIVNKTNFDLETFIKELISATELDVFSFNLGEVTGAEEFVSMINSIPVIGDLLSKDQYDQLEMTERKALHLAASIAVRHATSEQFREVLVAVLQDYLEADESQKEYLRTGMDRFLLGSYSGLLATDRDNHPITEDVDTAIGLIEDFPTDTTDPDGNLLLFVDQLKKLLPTKRTDEARTEAMVESGDIHRQIGGDEIIPETEEDSDETTRDVDESEAKSGKDETPKTTEPTESTDSTESEETGGETSEVSTTQGEASETEPSETGTDGTEGVIPIEKGPHAIQATVTTGKGADGSSSTLTVLGSLSIASVAVVISSFLF